jgi:hypothetical protein
MSGVDTSNSRVDTSRSILDTSKSLLAPTTKKSVIRGVFNHYKPRDVLPILIKRHHYKAIDECRCNGPFSRIAGAPEIPDARAIAERGIVEWVLKKAPSKKESRDSTLYITSIASAKAFKELVLIHQLQTEVIQKGVYKDILITLVDPYYKTPSGIKTLAQFREIAHYLSPGITVLTLNTIKKIWQTGFSADVFIRFDDGMMNMNVDGHHQLIAKFDSHLKSLSQKQPVIYLCGEKLDKGGKIQGESLVKCTQVKVALEFRSPEKTEQETLLDCPIYDQESITDADVVDRGGQLLQSVVVGDDYEGIQLLAKNGVPLNQEGNGGFHPLRVASQKGLFRSMQALLELRVDVDQQREETLITALHSAVFGSSAKSIEYLVKTHKATIDLPEQNGLTPLHLAAGMGKLDCIRILVELGACLDLEDYYGHTPIQLFEMFLKRTEVSITPEHEAIIKLLSF